MFSTESHGPWTVVHPVGELDLAVVDEFRASVLEALSRPGQVAIDFSEVTFLDSTGLGVIATAEKKLKDRGGHLVLTGLTERTRRALEIAGMTKILDIRDELTDHEQFAVEWILDATT